MMRAATRAARTSPFFSRLPLEREAVKLGRQVRRGLLALQPEVAPLVPAGLVPQLEPVALPDQHGVPRQRGELAQLGRHQQPTLPVYIWSQLRFPNKLPGVLAMGAVILIASCILVVIAEWVRQLGTSERKVGVA